MELLAELASESRSAFTRHSRGEGEGQGGTGGRLIWKMSVGSFSDSDTPPHPGYHSRLEANWGSYRILVAPWNIMHTFFTAMKTDHWTEARADIQLWAQRAVGLKLPMLDHAWPYLTMLGLCLTMPPDHPTDLPHRLAGIYHRHSRSHEWNKAFSSPHAYNINEHNIEHLVKEPVKLFIAELHRTEE